MKMDQITRDSVDNTLEKWRLEQAGEDVSHYGCTFEFNQWSQITDEEHRIKLICLIEMFRESKSSENDSKFKQFLEKHHKASNEKETRDDIDGLIAIARREIGFAAQRQNLDPTTVFGRYKNSSEKFRYYHGLSEEASQYIKHKEYERAYAILKITLSDFCAGRTCPRLLTDMGLLYIKGWGTKQNPTIGRFLWSEACKRGDEKSIMYMRICMEKKLHDYDKDMYDGLLLHNLTRVLRGIIRDNQIAIGVKQAEDEL